MDVPPKNGINRYWSIPTFWSSWNWLCARQWCATTSTKRRLSTFSLKMNWQAFASLRSRTSKLIRDSADPYLSWNWSNSWNAWELKGLPRPLTPARFIGAARGKAMGLAGIKLCVCRSSGQKLLGLLKLCKVAEQAQQTLAMSMVSLS